jgi:hypothetical protein
MCLYVHPTNGPTPRPLFVHEHLLLHLQGSTDCEPDETQPAIWPRDGRQLATLIASLLAGRTCLYAEWSRSQSQSHGRILGPPFVAIELRSIQPSDPSMAASAAPSVAPLMNHHFLASLISIQPDFTIFRRFLESNARDLVRLQGEIIHLESDLGSIIAADRASSDPENAEFEFCITSLKGPPHPSREKGLQWEKQVELGHKLAAYR